MLREIIAQNAQVPWVGQISINLLRDEELVSLIARSGCKWIFMGLESIDSANLKSMRKGFNKPEDTGRFWSVSLGTAFMQLRPLFSAWMANAPV